MDAIVFDWDGTLIDSLPAIYEANRAVLEEFGLPFDLERYRQAYIPDWRLMYERLGVPRDLVTSAGARWLELYQANEASATLLSGGAEAIRRLADAGYVLGLITAGNREIVTSQLQRVGLDPLFAVRVFGNDAFASKPHPDPLVHVLDRLDRSERIATARYVGDVPDDMRMARAVGVIGIGIQTSTWRREDLVEAGAAEVFPSVAAFVDELLAEATGSHPAAGHATPR